MRKLAAAGMETDLSLYQFKCLNYPDNDECLSQNRKRKKRINLHHFQNMKPTSVLILCYFIICRCLE